MREAMAICVFGVMATAIVFAQSPPISLQVTNAAGVRFSVDEPNGSPSLRIRFAGLPDSDPGILVLFPEHVTVRVQGGTEAQHLYQFQAGRPQTIRPSWRRSGPSIEYEAELQTGVRMRARATLEADGVRYRYEFTNRSDVDYDMVQAVTDPRMLTPYLRDVRLERTYVHHANGFELLAAETPDRISMPQDRWLPNRHRVSYSWPVESERIVKQADGITWYNKSHAIDVPFLATKSTDGKWIMATFSYDPGNVWVNPDLTCQHADPQIPLRRGQTRAFELKTLIVQGTLETILAKVKQQRLSLQH